MQKSNSMQGGLQSASPETSSSASVSSLGWPFGLPTCMDIHTPGPEDQLAPCQTPIAFHQQFMNLQTTFLLPFFSDVDASSNSDTDSRFSEAASSFFKDSRRITLGSLISLPMDTSFRTMYPDTHYHVFTDRRRNHLPSCGILELLGCCRNAESSRLHEFDFSELEGEVADSHSVAAVSTSLAAYLQLEASNSPDAARTSAPFEDALSTGSRSPDWNDQFISCHSILSDGEWTGKDMGERIANPVSSTSAKPSPRQTRKSTPHSPRMQRSSSMKSFFSSICCRIDTAKAPWCIISISSPFSYILLPTIVEGSNSSPEICAYFALSSCNWCRSD